MQIFFENVSVILDREQDELEKMLDIGVYTCMVYASLGKILNYELKNILPIMLAFIETDVSVSAFSKYLNVFLSDDILNTIEEECDNEFLSSSLVELIQNNSIFGQDATIAIPILNKQLQDYLEKYSKKRKVDWSKGWFTEEISYQKIYQKVWEQMNYFNEYTASPIYNEEQFRKLAQLKKFIYLNEEEQALFLKTVQVMDEKISSALDKIDRIFMLIDSFSLNIKENCVITVDFKNKRK